MELSGGERGALERWARRPRSSRALALRCRIVLAAAGGGYNRGIAEELGCHPATVAEWSTRFAVRRLDGLCDDPRPGPPRTIADAKVEEAWTDNWNNNPRPFTWRKTADDILDSLGE